MLVYIKSKDSSVYTIESYCLSTGNAPSPGTIQANSNVSAPTTATLSHPGSQGMSQQIDSQYTNISVAAAMNHQQ